MDIIYKTLSLRFLIQGQGKYLVENNCTDRGERGNYFKWYYDGRWTPDNRITTKARAWNRDDEYWAASVNPNTYWYDNMAYCRLKNLVLNYTLPQILYKRIGISKADVYFSGNNLALLWAAQRNYDPEVATPREYPTMKTFAIGANIIF